jgi:hypothetical protein
VGGELRRLVALDSTGTASAAAALIDRLVAAGRLARAGDRVRDPAHRAPATSPASSPAARRLLAALDVPAPAALADAARAAGCPPDVVRALEVTGEIVRVDGGLAWSAGQWRRLAEQALALARQAPLAPATLRDATATSRKYVMALLEDLDRQAILVRTPAGHVPGPRAGTLEAKGVGPVPGRDEPQASPRRSVSAPGDPTTPRPATKGLQRAR